MTNEGGAIAHDAPSTWLASRMARLRVTSAMLLFGWSIHVPAFWDPPYVDPSNPTATDDVAVKVHMRECDAIFAVPAYP
jgi:hypothetical protein